MKINLVKINNREVNEPVGCLIATVTMIFVSLVLLFVGLVLLVPFAIPVLLGFLLGKVL